MLTEINTKEDVILFAKALIAEGVNFHPDEDFHNYINVNTGADTYSADEAVLRNKLMERSFEICERSGIDIYDLTMEVFLTETGLSDTIPLPSENLMIYNGRHSFGKDKKL